MGVPKFFRWISERYPRINQPLDENIIVPDIDHLYFDLNGIIHMCSHNNNNTLSLRMNDEDIFKNMEAYMDLIVREIIKPKASVFIAVDGVAPRAKLNQQRGRRFRAARERMQIMNVSDDDDSEALTGKPVVEYSDEHIFDSNCITPATEFMAKLDLFLQDMISRKLNIPRPGFEEEGMRDNCGSEGSAWGPINVIYSGHSVPGEGEHKIMQHIRTSRAKPDYRANQRHCLYGQDADLLMLGLATHEPHFTILREVVQFKKTGNSNTNLRQPAADEDEVDDNSLPLGLVSLEFFVPSVANFQLLHLSVLREYLEVEFMHLHTGDPLDRERLIDDFILMTFLVGNDFLPHLPALEIHENAFEVIFQAYKGLQRTEGVEYLITDGEISNFTRLEKLFSIIGDQEEKILKKREVEAKVRALKFDPSLSSEEKKLQAQEIMDEFEEKCASDRLPNPSATPYQQKYYLEKFSNDTTDLIQTEKSFSAHSIESFVPVLVKEYVKGLMWCFHYYAKGCVSWDWYYPYHYGPMMKDVVNIEKIAKEVTFKLSSPLPPFQQLLGCLPPSSVGLLPTPYHSIMTSNSSPMIEYYPMDFLEDMNGKHNSWEAVVLLPFINIDRLKEAVADVENNTSLMDTISEAEKIRNGFGEVLDYRPIRMQNSSSQVNRKESTSALTSTSSSVTYIIEKLPPVNTPGKPFSPSMIPGTVIPFDSFPSLRSLPINFVLIKLLRQRALMGMTYKTLFLGMNVKEMSILNDAKLMKMLGQHVFVNYPMRHEALVVAVGTPLSYFSLKKKKKEEEEGISAQEVTSNEEMIGDNVEATQRPRGIDETSEWYQYASQMQDYYLAGHRKDVAGSGTSGFMIGPVNTVLTVLPVVTSVIRAYGVPDRTYAQSTAQYPLQLVVFPSTKPPRRERADANHIKFKNKQQSVPVSVPVSAPVRSFSSSAAATAASGVRKGFGQFQLLLRKIR